MTKSEKKWDIARSEYIEKLELKIERIELVVENRIFKNFLEDDELIELLKILELK